MMGFQDKSENTQPIFCSTANTRLRIRIPMNKNSKNGLQNKSKNTPPNFYSTANCTEERGAPN